MRQFVIADTDAGKRLDAYLKQQIDGVSRAKLKALIDAGNVTVDEHQPTAASIVRRGQRVVIDLSALPNEGPLAEEMPLEVLHEDSEIVAINKPSGMVVHPAKGHWQGTLASGLMHLFGQLSRAGGNQRPGIVHRLDRDTSGVILVAKTDEAHMSLAGQFERRDVQKRYLAIVTPPPDRDRDIISQPIGPHPYQRERMAIRTAHPLSRSAETFYEVLRRMGRFALVAVNPKTGRTHQIRVHLAHIGCPILADRLYSGRCRWTRSMLIGGSRTPNIRLASTMQSADDTSDARDPVVLARQALHAESITFRHPRTGELMTIVAPIPDDMATVLKLVDAPM